VARPPAPPELRALLGLLAASVLVADVAGVVVLGHAGPGATVRVGGAVTSTTVRTGAPLGPGQSVVDGTITGLDADGATGPPLATPFVVTVPVRGRGQAIIYHARVGTSDDDIFWNAGVPLSVTGQGALVPGRDQVHVDPTGATWFLDGAERLLAPGSYHISATVGVGPGGLLTPMDGVDFTAGPDTVMVSQGAASTHRDPAVLQLVGPGTIAMTGALKVRTAAGLSPTTALTFGPGPFTVTITPGPGGLTVHALLSGHLAPAPPP